MFRQPVTQDLHRFDHYACKNYVIHPEALINTLGSNPIDFVAFTFSFKLKTHNCTWKIMVPENYLLDSMSPCETVETQRAKNISLRHLEGSHSW